MMERLVNPPERDLGRATWMRSVGAVVFSQAADELFREGQVPPPDGSRINEAINACQDARAIDPLFARAHLSLIDTLDSRSPAGEFYWKMAPEVTKAVRDYTHVKQPHNVLREAIRSQVSLPLNLVQLISIVAEQQEQEGFTVNSYEDMGMMLIRPDFKTMIQTALFTRNGVWGALSSDAGLSPYVLDVEHVGSSVSDRARIVADGLEFEDTSVFFSDEFKKFLTDEIRNKNRYGDRDASLVSHMSSSGCPVRHLRPSMIEQETLKALAEHYHVSPEQLTKRRETTVVEDGLRFMATVLMNFERYERGELITYSDSAESRV